MPSRTDRTRNQSLLTPSRTDRTCYIIMLAVVAAIYATMSYLTPMQYDDLLFIATYRQYLPEGSGDMFDSDAWTGYINELRQYDNSRISNMLSPFSTIIEPFRTVFPYITGLCVAAIVAMTVRLAGYRRRLVVPGVAAWTAITVFLPWRNFIFVPDYSLNYIYSATVTMLFVVMLLRVARRPSRWLTAAAVLMAVVAGGWHEGFAIPTVAGLGVYTLVRRFRMPLRWYAVVGVYVVAALLFCLSPGMLSRGTRELTEPTAYVDNFKMLCDLILVIGALFVVIVMAVVPAWRHTLREQAVQPVFVIFMTAALASATISVVFAHTARTAFWPEMCAIVALAALLRPAVAAVSARPASYAGAGVLTALLMTHAVHAARWQYMLREEYREIMARFESGEMTVYYDIIMPESVPATTLYFPSKSTWVTWFQYNCLDQMLGSYGHAVVPTSLRYAGGADDEQLAGDAGMRRTGTALWLPDESGVLEPLYSYDITLVDGTQLPEHQCHASQFTLADGTPALYIKPYYIDARDVASVSKP